MVVFPAIFLFFIFFAQLIFLARLGGAGCFFWNRGAESRGGLESSALLRISGGHSTPSRVTAHHSPPQNPHLAEYSPNHLPPTHLMKQASVCVAQHVRPPPPPPPHMTYAAAGPIEACA
ncbi:hypothetical protein DFP73DRAFT_569443 [Morchella snyderi]|nr:hypothetical protein DFP73DRAFT_569443 [Morchella snyderi]